MEQNKLWRYPRALAGACRLSLALLLFVFPGAVLAQEGSNGPVDVAQGLAARYQQATFVAEVQIAGIHRDVDRALSEPGMVAIKGYVYSALSQRVWKGETSSLVAFRRGLDACAKKLQQGQRYLIFATPDVYGRLQLLSCEAAVPEAEAAPLLAQLEQVKPAG